jgi:hypothetical protein
LLQIGRNVRKNDLTTKGLLLLKKKRKNKEEEEERKGFLKKRLT